MKPIMLFTCTNPIRLRNRQTRTVVVLSAIAFGLIPVIASAQTFVDGISPAISAAEQKVVNRVLSPIQSTLPEMSGTVSDATEMLQGVNGMISTITNLPGQIKNDLLSVKNSVLNTLEGSFSRINQTNDIGLNAQVIDSLDPVKVAIQQNSGKLGIPDPFKTETQILATLPNTQTNSRVNPTILISGQIPLRASDKMSDAVLSLEGQQEHADAFQSVLDSGTLLGLLSQASNQTGTAVAQAATGVTSAAQSMVPVTQSSVTLASRMGQQSTQIQSATSTQDAVKGLGIQNAMIGSLLSNQSSQQTQLGVELAGISGELGGLSSQTTQSAQQLKEIGTLLGDQDKTLRSLETISAVSNLNLSQLVETNQGQIQQVALQQKRTYSQLDGRLGYVLAH